MSSFVHQVEMSVQPQFVAERLRRIEGWCADWQIGFRVINPLPGADRIRLAFEDRRLARAVTSHFGGVLVADDEIHGAFAADDADEDAYDRMTQDSGFAEGQRS